MTEAHIQFAIEDIRYSKKERRERKLHALKVELINLGMMIDQLEKKLLYGENSEGAEKILNIRLVQLRKCYSNKLYQLKEHANDKNSY